MIVNGHFLNIGCLNILRTQNKIHSINHLLKKKLEKIVLLFDNL
jgi:hypothetical protein